MEYSASAAMFNYRKASAEIRHVQILHYLRALRRRLRR